MYQFNPKMFFFKPESIPQETLRVVFKPERPLHLAQIIKKLLSAILKTDECDLHDLIEVPEGALSPELLIEHLIAQLRFELTRVRADFYEQCRQLNSALVRKKATELITQWNNKYSLLYPLDIDSLIELKTNDAGENYYSYPPLNMTAVYWNITCGFRGNFLAKKYHSYGEIELNSNEILCWTHGSVGIDGSDKLNPIRQQHLLLIFKLLSKKPEYAPARYHVLRSIVRDQFLTISGSVLGSFMLTMAQLSLDDYCSIFNLILTENHTDLYPLMLETKKIVRLVHRLRINSRMDLYITLLNNLIHCEHYESISQLVNLKLIDATLIANPKINLLASLVKQLQFPLVSVLFEQELITWESIAELAPQSFDIGWKLLWLLVKNNQYFLVKQMWDRGHFSPMMLTQELPLGEDKGKTIASIMDPFSLGQFTIQTPQEQLSVERLVVHGMSLFQNRTSFKMESKAQIIKTDCAL